MGWPQKGQGEEPRKRRIEIKGVIEDSERHMEETEEEEWGGAWGDVHWGGNPLKLVKESKKEEVTFIE
eukprot:929137-Karenia_brevis.AAC.1